jgi:hypothetical protein
MAGSKSGSSTGAKRGFAAMSAEKQREIASKGGKASHGGGRRSGKGSSGSR